MDLFQGTQELHIQRWVAQIIYKYSWDFRYPQKWEYVLCHLCESFRARLDWVLNFIMYYIHVPKSKFVAICNTIEGKHKQMQISYNTVYLPNHIFHPLWCHEMFIFVFAKFLIAKNWAKYVSHLILSLSLWCCLVP